MQNVQNGTWNDVTSHIISYDAEYVANVVNVSKWL